MNSTAKNIELSSLIEMKRREDKPKKDRLSINIVSEEEYSKELHSADALKNESDINDMLLELYNNDDIDTLAFFIVGINTGYRPVDILAWRWKLIENADGSLMSVFAMPEHKTGKTTMVNLNETVKSTLSWYKKRKKTAGTLISDDDFVFVNGKNRRNSFVFLEKENDRLWHQDNVHKKKGLMFAYSEKGSIICDENVILNDTDRFIKLRKPIDTDSISRHLKACAENANIKGHYSSYTIRQTFSYWFRQVLKHDKSLADVADEYFSSMLLSSYFQHSSLKLTQTHYMRDQQEIFSKVISQMNLGKEAVELVIDADKELICETGTQTRFF